MAVAVARPGVPGGGGGKASSVAVGSAKVAVAGCVGVAGNGKICAHPSTESNA